MPTKNVVVAQSGGPSPVINNSLRGVVETCLAYPNDFGTIYAARHGVEGILKEELIDMSAQSAEEIALLRNTPASGASGTCRYKLRDNQPEDMERIIEVFMAHDIGYFFYIGGNDSMDTANKIGKLAHQRGLDLIATGVPKTIDNDVGDSEFKLIDHTPGYGSAARYWAYEVQNMDEENRGSCTSDPVLVMQAMGRKIGYIPAAARLGDPERKMPMVIFMAESGYDLEQLADIVNEKLKQAGRCMVVVSEGFPVGSLGERRDGFGHIEYAASATSVERVVLNYLNDHGLSIRGLARGQDPECDQRATSIHASTVDIEEAWEVGSKAALIAREGESGWMATILRRPGEIYAVDYEKVPLEKVANSERKFPASWMTEDRLDVTDDFIRYARPLIGDDWPSVPLINGIQRFARIEPIFAERKLNPYIPQGWRK